MNEIIVEWVGYAAMVTLMVSFLMKDIKNLRYINTVGCILFVVYGFMLDSYPVIITNAFISLVNLYYLFIKKD
jgi:uncharacterized protein with PQ loop repeat